MAVLSDAKIRALKPKDKPFKTADFDGLFVLTKPNGSKLWRFKYRWLGKEKLLALGKYPDVSLKQARSKRDDARSMLADNQDPSAVAKRMKAEQEAEHRNTFARLASDLLEKKHKEGRAQATLAKTSWLHGMLCAEIGSMPIAQITARDVLVPLKKAEAKGNYETALRMRSAAGAVFRFAISQGLIDNDPTFGLKDALVRPKPNHRAAILDPEGVGALLNAIDGFEGQPTTRIALQLLSLTALRPGELRMAEWSEIDESGSVWIVPDHRAKMRRPHAVPLSNQAQSKLAELKNLTSWGTYLFSVYSVIQTMYERQHA
ncbi:tyrosine-type recombinase/integrase [Ruegeria sp. ANG-S4]|uniref:tyrosine-type recombinase/integrase n=1 Tax=Ruegeria sp. ANG-S4 TaxID=1577904 RepID=UPI000B049E01|nr:integrase arm-type DNA-binding domain-containing protein [Ruegeria sp. ANG-S4]